MRKTSNGASSGIPANAEGQPIPRSRNKEGSSNASNAAAGGPNGQRKGGQNAGGLPGSGQTPAVGGAQNSGAPGSGGNVATAQAERSNGTSSSLNENDTFNKHYNKELRVSKDEIPIVLAELNDSAYRFIKREQYERALNLLQKAYGIMDVIDFKSCRRDKFHLFVMFHNMALCYQKMQMLEECASCIDQALDNLPMDNLNLEERSISNRMRKLVIISRLKMQFCAILSQIHRHKDALEQAREGVRLGHLLINDLRELCLFYIRREDISVAGNISNFYSVDNLPGPYDQPKDDHATNQSNYNSNNSLLKNRAGGRNRSFTSFLSQVEAYGGYDSLNAGHPDKSVGGGANNVSALSRQSSHNLSSFYSANQLESSMSYIEKTARKLFPILNELKKRMVPEKKRTTSSSASQAQRKRSANVPRKMGNASVLTLDPVDDEIQSQEDNEDQLLIDLGSENQKNIGGKQNTDMKNILGYLNQGEWTSKLSIGSIMQLQPYKIKDLIEQGQNELELTRESFIQKVSALAVAYFCYSTEIRFIIQMKEDTSFDTPQKQKESEFWHAKSLELACTFLPGECPLLNHINLSYQKHFAPVKSTILEDASQEDDLMVIKPLNGVDNNKVQPIIRRLSNVQVAITPFQLTPINQVTKQVISQMLSFNEYQETSNNGGGGGNGAVGQNILPAALVRSTNQRPIGQPSVGSGAQHNQSVSNIGSNNQLDQISGAGQAKHHSMSVNHNLAAQKDNSMSEFDSFLNDVVGGVAAQPSTKGAAQGRKQQRDSVDDIDKLDILLKKLIDSKKISKKQLIQKLMSVNEAGGEMSNGDEDFGGGFNENIPDGDSEDDSQNRVPRNGSHRNQISNTNSNFYKYASQDQLHSQKNDRPKSSKGTQRTSMQSKVSSNNAVHHRSNANVKAQHLSMKVMENRIESAKDGTKSGSVSMMQAPQAQSFSTNQHSRGSKKIESSASNMMHPQSHENSKHLQGGKSQISKSKKDVRPLSGGISQKHYNKQSESRSRVAQSSANHNLSMFDKMGGGAQNKIHASPPGPVDFQSKQMPASLKPMGSKIQHNQSFDSMPVHNQLVSHAGQHGSKLGRQDQSKLVASAQNSFSKGPPHGGQHSSTHQALQSVAPAPNSVANNGQQPGPNPQNPQAYDELKKRLLNEYKKLVNNKKSAPGANNVANQPMMHEVNESRDNHGRNLTGVHQKSGERGTTSNTGSKTGAKKHSSRMNAASQNNSAGNAVSAAANDFSAINGLSQQHINLLQNSGGQALVDSSIGQTASPKAAAHLNVYKPTFIINNSFQNELNNQEEAVSRPNPSGDHGKKYSRGGGSKNGPSSVGQSTNSMIGGGMGQQPMSGSGMHSGKHGSSLNGVSYQNSSTSAGGSGLPSQSRLKKNSAIDRSNSAITGVTSGKLAHSKASQKLHGGDSALHTGSSKHHTSTSSQQREFTNQGYLADKQGSSHLGKHSSSGHHYTSSYLAASQHAHPPQIPTSSAVEIGRSASSSIVDHHFSHGVKSGGAAGYISNHQMFKHQNATNAGSSKVVQPRRQNVSAGGASMGPLTHHSGIGITPATSQGTRSNAYDKLKKKMNSRP